MNDGLQPTHRAAGRSVQSADDRFSSVEAMLRWKSTGLRESITNGLKQIDTLPELYPLPKPNDGLPDQWAFAPRTLDEHSKMVTRQSLEFTLKLVNRADAAILSDDYTLAIECLMSAQLGERGAWNSWHSAASIRTWRYVSGQRKRRAKNAIKGNQLRTKYDDMTKARWRAELLDLIANGYTKHSAAHVVAKRHNQPLAAVRTIRGLV